MRFIGYSATSTTHRPKARKLRPKSLKTGKRFQDFVISLRHNNIFLFNEICLSIHGAIQLLRPHKMVYFLTPFPLSAHVRRQVTPLMRTFVSKPPPPPVEKKNKRNIVYSMYKNKSFKLCCMFKKHFKIQ